MSCNFCKNVVPSGFTQYCPKVGGKEIIYDQSCNCNHYDPKDDAPDWCRRPNKSSQSNPDQFGNCPVTGSKCENTGCGSGCRVFVSESKTPRTDEAAWIEADVVEASFARQLESELATVTEQRDHMTAKRNALDDVLNDLWHRHSLMGAAYELIENARAKYGNLSLENEKRTCADD